ncbi:FecR family protein [Pinibacter aurantiacus]|uniref:FecR family protein n=1 Tax=Pinibacter aurantiacus TaxID=2851599 RepID=A0A9E2W8T8_9BACT|nr:FecR family protein [Pinibacter aurantiacus]MBV4358667.1 FecR family protein [Pinibacter aurantiacus]
MDQQKLQYLLKRYFDKACTESEWQELFAVMNDADKKEEVQELLSTMMQHEGAQEFEYNETKWEPVLNTILAEQKQAPLSVESEEETNVVEMQPRRRIQWRWIAAASVILLFASIAALKFSFWKNSKGEQSAFAGKVIKQEHAILTLADGTQIVLDSAENGQLSQQGNIKVIKLSAGQIVYSGRTEKANSQYNTITTPKGVQYQLTLPDGTMVWINAASSLKFPVSFDGDKREVTLTGEAYFEVAKNKAASFTVHAKSNDIQVLGTHFNVMAYDDEEATNTTLLEGKVKVVAENGNSILLKPNQQAQYREGGNIKVKNDVDVDEVMAWKNNFFIFHDADIETIMRQLSRWYNINITYKSKVKYLFQAEIPRNQAMDSVLKALALTGNVHFEVKGNDVTVTR